MRELEKKADKYAYEVYSTRPLGDDPTDDEIKEAYIQDYKDAMAWHYPSRGEYPTEGEEVWVSWSSNGDYGVEKFYHNKNGEEVWGMKLSSPYAWQYIVPPKEEA